MLSFLSISLARVAVKRAFLLFGKITILSASIALIASTISFVDGLIVKGDSKMTSQPKS